MLLICSSRDLPVDSKKDVPDCPDRTNPWVELVVDDSDTDQ
jgi:hypothetical protein